MEMERNEVMELIMLGLHAKVEKKQKSIITGEKMLEKMGQCNNKRFEVKEKIDRLKNELDEIYTKMNDVLWFDEIGKLKIL